MNLNNFKSLFLKNLGTKQTIFKNIFWLTIGEGALRFSTFLLIIYAARAFGPAEFGKFAFALAAVSLFAIFSDLGLSDIITRDFARDKEEEKEFSAIISLKIILSIGTFLLIVASSFFIVFDPLIRIIMWLLGVYLIFNSFSTILYAFLRARMLMEYEAWVKIFQAILGIVAGFYIILNFPSAMNLSYGYLITSFVVLIFLLFFFNFRIQPLRIAWNQDIWKKFLGRSWPLGLAMIFSMVYLYIDSVMLGFWGQINEVGWYNAAYRITGIPLVAMALISMSFYPILSKFFKESKGKFQKFWNYQMGIMIILAMPLIIGGIFMASKIIVFFYGVNYMQAIPVFRLLILVAGINFLFVSYNIALVVSNQQKKHLWICLITAVVNIALNLVLIPRYSFYGAGLSTLFSYIILLTLEVEFSRRFTPIIIFNLKLIKILIIATISSIIMLIVLQQPVLYYGCNFPMLFLIGAAVYFITLLLFYKLSQLYAHLVTSGYKT